MRVLSAARLVAPPYAVPQIRRGFDNHESYLMCPGQPAMKVETSFPVSSVRVFYRKLPKHHHLTDAVQNQIHVTRSENTLPKNFIDIYHWSVD